ncbi:MAG: outer membrane beta-barrel protein [Alphaproteobacteria bacterium]|nr:outer membrane beta-barrel protein [Alphaproteobacteria bacterium]
MLLERRVGSFGQIFLALCIVAGGWLTVAHAQEVTSNRNLQATIKQVFSYNTNPLMVVDGARSLWGSTTSPGLAFASATPVSQIKLGGRIDQNLFNQSAFNTTDFHANGGYLRKSERWRFEVQGSGDYDSTRTSEPANYGIRPVVSRHVGLFASPALSFSPTQTGAISLSGSVFRSQYDLRDFTNYMIFTVSPSYTHQFDPLNSGVLTFQARQYRATRESGTKVLTLSPTVGWLRTFSERLKATASVGAQASREYSYGAPVGNWKPSFVFSGGLTFEGQQDRINLAASRLQNAYGNGSDALQSALSISATHRLNPVLSLVGGMSYLTAEYSRASTGDLESLSEMHGGIAYHLTPTVDVTADCRYRYETLKNQEKNATGSIFMAGLVYRPDALGLGD